MKGIYRLLRVMMIILTEQLKRFGYSPVEIYDVELDQFIESEIPAHIAILKIDTDEYQVVGISPLVRRNKNKLSYAVNCINVERVEDAGNTTN